MSRAAPLLRSARDSARRRWASGSTLETLAARAVGTVSRAAGRGGGTTLPGQAALEGRSGRGRRARGAALRPASRSSRRRTARRRRPRWRRAILGARHRLAWNRAGANLLSGVASALVAGAAGRARPVRGRRGRAAGGDRARPGRASSRSGTSSATSSTATASSSSSPSAGARPCTTLPGERDARRQRRRSASSADLADGRDARRPLRAGRPAARAPDAPARRRLEVLPPLRGAVRVRRRVRRAPRRLPLPRVRPRAAAARRRRARDRAHAGSTASRFRLVTPHGGARRRAHASRALQRLQRRRRRVARARARRAARRRSRRARGVQRRVRPLRADPAGREAIVMLLIKNPAGANEAVRTLETGVPPVLVVALNDAIADGQDVSWIWDVDFEPLLPHVGRVVATGERAAELALRLMYGGFPTRAARGRPRPRAGARPRARARRRRHGARRPADLHGDARAAGDPHEARARAAVLGARA